MNNNTESSVTGSISIYSREDSTFSPLEITDGNTEINRVKNSFHLSTSNQYRDETGFTGQSGIAYQKVTTLTDFHRMVTLDVSGSLFRDNYRGSGRMIKSDVLVFDIDNHSNKDADLFENYDLHLTIDKFTKIFEDYEFFVATSLNHQTQKGKQGPRDKFHVFMSLGEDITDCGKYDELLEMIDYYIKSQIHDYEQIEVGGKEDYSLIDGAVGHYSQIWGNRETNVYYNEGASIYGLLLETNFSDDFTGYTRDSRKRGNRRFKEDSTFSSNYESDKDNLLKDWDYINLISRFGHGRFYEIAYKMGGGYYMGYCDLHDDNKASLQIFQNGGYNCFGCGSSGISALGYEARKTGKTTSKIRHELVDELRDLHHQDYIIWLNKKEQKVENHKEKREMNEELKKQIEDEHENDLEGQMKITEQEVTSSKSDNSDDVVEVIDEDDYQQRLIDEYCVALTNDNSSYVNIETYEALEEMNIKHAILSQDGILTIMVWETNRHSDYKELKFSSLPDFKNRYKNRRHKVMRYKKGKPVVTSTYISALWELWEHRRQYDGIDFWPYDERNHRYDDDEYIWDFWDEWQTATKENGWSGDSQKRGLVKFLDTDKLESIESMINNGDKQYQTALQGCSLYIKHISDVILGKYKDTNKHKDMLNYMVSWMSRCLTNHGDDRVKVAVVLQGRQGSGKGMMVSRFGEIFGRHFLHIQDSGVLTNNFNIHMMDKLLVYVNEAVFAGNKQTMNRLKGLLTEDEIQLEAKYMNSFTGRSYLRFIYSSNEDWVVPIEWDDRRYWVIEVSDRYVNKRDSREYFGELMGQWRSGGKESLYKFLTSDTIMNLAKNVDYEFDRPRTAASSWQLLQTEPILGWFHNLLTMGGHSDWSENGNGGIKPWDVTGDSYCNKWSIKVIHDDYRIFIRDRGNMNWNIVDKGVLSRRLNQFSNKYGFQFRSHRVNKNTKKNADSSGSNWEFGPLEQLKDAWVKNVWGGDWDEAFGREEKDDNLDDFVEGDDDSVAEDQDWSRHIRTETATEKYKGWKY